MDEDFEQIDVKDWITNLPPISEEQREKNRIANSQADNLLNVDGIFGDAMKEQFGLPDWTHRELPWMDQKFYHELIEIINPNNIKVISGSVRQASEGDLVRASVLISPEGMKKLAEKSEEE